MATVAVTKTEGMGRTHRYIWSGLGNGDDGEAVTIPGAPDMTVQVYGTFGVAGNVIVEGSLEESPANWFQVTDAADNLVSFLAGGGEIVAPVLGWCRPRVIAGDGTTSLTVILLARSAT